MTTLYDILGVPPSATDAEIKAAYRKAAMRWHPDRNLDNQAEADRKFKELAHAFSVLSDGDKRRAYDQARASEQPEESAAHEDDDAAARVFFKTMFELANELAQRGYNSDVLLGAMLSQGCPEGVARAIAEQVAAARKRSSGASTQNPRPRTSPPASAPPAASGAPATQARQSSLGTWAFGLFLAFSIVWAALKMSGGDAAQESQDAPAMPVAVAGAPQALQAPQAQLAPLLPPNVVAFNEESQAGLIKYDRLPEDEAFNSLRGSIDKAFKFKLEQTLQAGKDKLLLFSSTPWSESDADAYSCHACSPLLSAMLVSDTAQGSVVKLPLQVLEPMGAWGRIELGGDSQPTIVNVAPGKLAAFVPSSDMAQGVSVSWARLFSLEKDGFKPLGGLKLLEDTMATSFCETDPSTCSRAESRVHFVKTARTNGYYDLAVTVRATKIGGGVKQQTETTSVLRFDGVQYAAPAVPKEQQAPTAVGAPAERVVESSEAH